MPAPEAARGPAKAGSGAISPGDREEIRRAIRKKYEEVARSAAGRFMYPTGREGATALGYDPGVLAAAPAGLLESFCGVGNPFALGPVLPGDAVLDIGCGGGWDLFVASRLAGSEGRLCGIDLTAAMAARARENLSRVGLANVEIMEVDSERLPFADRSFDVILSNGVINLSPVKEAFFREIHRVLKAGGRLQLADVVLEGELPASLAGSAEAWSQ